MAKDINRLKVVLAEKKRTGKCLSETIGKDMPQYLNGVLILPNQDLKHFLK